MGLDTITPQGGEEGHCLPVTVRDLCREPAAPRAPTSDWSHVGLDPGFLDEDVARPRPERPKAVRNAETARKTPLAEFHTIELHLGGWGGGRALPPTL